MKHKPPMSRLKAFAVLGPTAGGKTALALGIAQKLPVEIISLDSALVYREMNIGTAKPTPDELAAVPHHLINIISPLQTYSAAEFAADCIRLTEEILAKGKIPLIVGGTMMYFHALTEGLNDLPSANADIRALLHQEKSQYGLQHLYARLQEVDPASAGRLKPNDSQRIERALEVYMLTGKPLSSHFAEQKTTESPLDLKTIALIPEDRSLLHKQISERFGQMLKNGFLEEVEQLRQHYPELHADMPSMRCVGYRQAWDFLEGACDYAEFVEKGTAATRQLAKRQLTWLRKIPLSHTLDPYQDGNCLQTALKLAEQHFDR